MAARLFQSVKRELVNPMIYSRMKMATDSSSSSSSSSGGSSGGAKLNKGLNQNEQRIQTALKALAVFLPGVYIGYICTDQGVFEPPEDPDKSEDQNGEKKDEKQDEKKDEKQDEKKDDKEGEKEEKKSLMGGMGS